MLWFVHQNTGSPTYHPWQFRPVMEVLSTSTPASCLLLRPPSWPPSACLMELYYGPCTEMLIRSPASLWLFRPVMEALSAATPAPRLLLCPPPWLPSACIMELCCGSCTNILIRLPASLWLFCPVIGSPRLHLSSPRLLPPPASSSLLQPADLRGRSSSRGLHKRVFVLSLFLSRGPGTSLSLISSLHRYIIIIAISSLLILPLLT